MADIDFDRQMFVPPSGRAPKPAPPLAGLLILVALIGALAFAGYKLSSDSSLFGSSAPASNLAKMQQQLDDMEKRLDNLEKRRKASVTAPAAVQVKTDTVSSSRPVRQPRPAFTISSASATKPQNNPSITPANPQSAPAPRPVQAPLADAALANHEAWEATANRLTDVIGMVGSQQGEISQTRDELNQMLAQTQRTAMQFELRRGTNPQPVGPVSLLLKGSDPKRQRYTLCVYVSNQCIELKDRSVGEVVVFVPSQDRVPLELVATKVARDAIVGYLEVPKDMQTP